MKNNDGFKVIFSTSSIAGIISAAGYFIYELARPKTLRDELIKEGIQILDKDTSRKENRKKWKSLVSQYKNNSNAEKIFSDLSLSKNVVSNQTERIKRLQEKCDNALDTFVSKAEPNLKEKVVDWCTSTSSFALIQPRRRVRS